MKLENYMHKEGSTNTEKWKTKISSSGTKNKIVVREEKD